MAEKEGTPAPKSLGRHRTRDSAADLLAASPVLFAIAKWTGKIGVRYVERLVVAGKMKEAKRNAAIIAAGIASIFLVLVGCVAWLALL
jgi:hypothetical protein